MKNTYIFLGILLFPSVLWSKHSIKFEVSPLGNLIYQLDCITQAAIFTCSQSDYIELWHSELKPAEADEKMLLRWKNSRKKLNQSIEYDEPDEVQLLTSANFPINANKGINVLDQVRMMAFAANNLDNYKKMMRFWVPINQLNEELTVLNYFWPRFQAWFNQQQPELDKFVIDAETLVKEHDVDDLLTAMRTFYQSDLPEDLELPVYLVAHPKQKAGTNGLVYNENSLIEVLKGEQAKSRLAVVIHEIAHFYHERASIENHLKHMQKFLSKESQTGKIGYYLFNEAIATAIGNGLFEQRMQSAENFKKYQDAPLSFYNNQGIDMAAKSALNLVIKQINAKLPIDNSFLTALDKIWGQSLHDIKDSPQQRFRHLGLLILDPSFDDMINEVIGIIRPSSGQITTLDDSKSIDPTVIEQYPQMDCLIIASNWQQVTPLHIPGVESKQKKENGIHVFDNALGTKYVVIIENDKQTINQHMTDMMMWTSF